MPARRPGARGSLVLTNGNCSCSCSCWLLVCGVYSYNKGRCFLCLVCDVCVFLFHKAGMVSGLACACVCVFFFELWLPASASAIIPGFCFCPLRGQKPKAEAYRSSQLQCRGSRFAKNRDLKGKGGGTPTPMHISGILSSSAPGARTV